MKEKNDFAPRQNNAIEHARSSISHYAHPTRRGGRCGRLARDAGRLDYPKTKALRLGESTVCHALRALNSETSNAVVALQSLYLLLHAGRYKHIYPHSIHSEDAT